MMQFCFPGSKRVLSALTSSETFVRAQTQQHRPTHLRDDIVRSKGPSWRQPRTASGPWRNPYCDSTATPPHPGAQASQAEDEQPPAHVPPLPEFSQLFVVLSPEGNELGHFGEPRILPIDRGVLPPPDRPWIRASRQRRETEEAVTVAISCRLVAN